MFPPLRAFGARFLVSVRHQFFLLAISCFKNWLISSRHVASNPVDGDGSNQYRRHSLFQRMLPRWESPPLLRTYQTFVIHPRGATPSLNCRKLISPSLISHGHTESYSGATPESVTSSIIVGACSRLPTGEDITSKSPPPSPTKTCRHPRSSITRIRPIAR